MARMPVVTERRLTRSHQALERVVEVLAIRGAVLVDDDEIDVEQLEAPILVSPQQLTNDVDVVELIDPNHDRRSPEMP